tara:strand:+ start:23 stop:466 length:444 start_codon:yes stop_codon:yes gene_type:complete
MKKEFVMRGQTASGDTEKLSFSGHKKGYAYKLVSFELYASSNLGNGVNELCGSITAGKQSVNPEDPNFNDEGLIGTAYFCCNTNVGNTYDGRVINDTFMITQDLILTVKDTSGNNFPVNWQCKFESVKMSGPEEAVTNYRQFLISDE